jgi:hypothetical protein
MSAGYGYADGTLKGVPGVAKHAISEGNKSNHAIAMAGAVKTTLGPRGRSAMLRAGVTAAESLADASAKSQHAHDLANNANSVGEYLQAANYAAQAAQEANDLDPSSAVVSGYAATANLAYNQIVAGGSTMSLSDANAVAVTGIEAADNAIAQATLDAGKARPPAGPPGGGGQPVPVQPAPAVVTPMSGTAVASAVVAVVAAGVAGYYGWKYLKRSKRRASAPRRRRLR